MYVLWKYLLNQGNFVNFNFDTTTTTTTTTTQNTKRTRIEIEFNHTAITESEKRNLSVIHNLDRTTLIQVKTDTSSSSRNRTTSRYRPRQLWQNSNLNLIVEASLFNGHMIPYNYRPCYPGRTELQNIGPPRPRESSNRGDPAPSMEQQQRQIQVNSTIDADIGKHYIFCSTRSNVNASLIHSHLFVLFSQFWEESSRIELLSSLSQVRRPWTTQN